jgi:putative holliday junction resolvase
VKFLALDLGDRWIGSATSDVLGIAAKPHITIEKKNIIQFLKKTFSSESISKVIVGYPKTLRGTESEQTKKVINEKNRLEASFPEKEWVLWDEKFSSQYASKLKKTKDVNQRSHSVAAAFILQSYLDHLQFKSTL